MKEKRITVVIKGEKYLMNKYSPQEQGSAKKATKKVYIPKDEAEKKTNRTKEGKLFLPSRQIKASLMRSAVNFIKNKRTTYKETMAAGVMIEPEEILFKPQEYSIAEHAVVINRSRVPAWRPVLQDWEVKFDIILLDEDIDPLQVKEILEWAGRFKGVGDWRPEKGGEYGRFHIDSWKLK